ncbi:MAG: hypothetical protein KatS3mg015_0273 [Fimbriimonadales bacterium]|nr:MAG: hypothetical protein KatS3mg015_0273 [Fimbriimonadales bacterium]
MMIALAVLISSLLHSNAQEGQGNEIIKAG